MKEILKATVLMAVIIAVQMVLSYAFTYHVAEVFSRVSVTFLLYYYVFHSLKLISKKIMPNQKKEVLKNYFLIKILFLCYLLL